MTQRIELIKSTAHNLKQDLIADSTPASLTGSSLDILSLIYPQSSQIRGRYAYIYSGAGAGQERVVGSFDTTNRRMVFNQVFDSIPSINSNVLVTDNFPKS